jgi:hypothetical protein
MNLAPKDTFVGRCKKCETVLRFVAPVHHRYLAQLGYGRAATVTVRSIPGGKTQEGYARLFVKCSCGSERSVECHLIVGCHSDKHQCGTRCLNATGPNCECSCSGANHGSGHGLTLS